MTNQSHDPELGLRMQNFALGPDQVVWQAVASTLPIDSSSLTRTIIVIFFEGRPVLKTPICRGDVAAALPGIRDGCRKHLP
jgi:hypothetical protein